MISVGVVSDTHGNIKNLNYSLDFLINQRKVNYLFHLGDNFSDLSKTDFKFDREKVKIFKVPGTYQDEYFSDDVENRIIFNLDKLNVLLTHVPCKHQNDKKTAPEMNNLILEKNIDIVFFGHTHQYDIKYSKVLYVNPGHLKDLDEQGTPPTFCYAEIDGRKIYIKIYNLLSETIFERRYIL